MMSDADSSFCTSSKRPGCWDSSLDGLSGNRFSQRHIVELPHRLFHGSREDLPNGLFVFKLDFRLGGMDVHVNIGGVDIDIEEEGHLFAHWHQALKGSHHRLCEIVVFHVSPVGEEKLVGALPFRRFGLSDISLHLADGGVHCHGQQVLVEAFAEDIDDALPQACGWQVGNLRSIAVEGECHLWVDEHDALVGSEDIVEFGTVRLEEFPSCGNVEEEVLDLELAALRTSHRLLSHEARPVNAELGAHLLFLSPRGQGHLGNGGDGGQGFASETHGMEVEEVAGASDFRCGMPLEGESRIGRRHAATVVDDLYHGPSGVQHDDMHFVGSCVERVLDEFLHDRRRPLDDLSGGNLVGDRIWEQLYDVTHGLWLFGGPCSCGGARPARQGIRTVGTVFPHLWPAMPFGVIVDIVLVDGTDVVVPAEVGQAVHRPGYLQDGV